MCSLPHHAGCSHGADGLSRRYMLKRLMALGLTVSLATLVLDRRAMGAISFLDRAELVDGVTALIARAKSPELREARSSDEADVACAEDADPAHGREAYRGANGRRPLAIESMVSLESLSSSEFTTQYVAPP